MRAKEQVQSRVDAIGEVKIETMADDWYGMEYCKDITSRHSISGLREMTDPCLIQRVFIHRFF